MASPKTKVMVVVGAGRQGVGVEGGGGDSRETETLVHTDSPPSTPSSSRSCLCGVTAVCVAVTVYSQQAKPGKA